MKRDHFPVKVASAIVLLGFALVSTEAQTTNRRTTNPPSQPLPPPARPLPPPERPSYTPPPERPSYTPPAPAQRPYTPPPAAAPRPYSPPPPSSGGSTGPSSPPTAPRTYAPYGSATSSPSGSGGTTYTPRVYTPGSLSGGSSSKAASSGSSDGVRNANGATTYTPHPPVGSSYSSATPTAGGGATYTPRSGAASYAAGGLRAVYSVPASSFAGSSASGTSSLTAAGSQSVLRQVNVSRSSLTGVNSKPIPTGQVAVHPDGKLTVSTDDGKKFDLRPNGTLAEFNKPGLSAGFRSSGRLASLHTSTVDIHRGPHGERTIVAARPGHSVLVSTGPHAGYLQRTVVHNSRNYIQRTYVVAGLRVSRVYTTYSYRGLVLDHFVPGLYYAPAFYGWAYYPWDAPAYYAWGWAGQPWYAYYGGYFSPWTAYLSGASWLADYYLGQTLAAGYQQQDASNQPIDSAAPPIGGDDAYAPADTPITPEIKQAIAEEVQQQLAYENAASTQPDQAPALSDLPQVLTPNHVFVVSQPLNVSTSDSQSCGLSAGNVLRVVAAPADGSPAANLTVVTSRRGDCPSGVQVTVPIEDLQEMQNNFRAQLDSGLKMLHAQQGQGGLPGAPNSAIAPPPRPTDELPADDENVQALLSAQQQQANQAEADVNQVAFSSQQ